MNKTIWMTLSFVVCAWCSNGVAQSMAAKDIIELRERLLFAGYPTSGSGETIDSGTLAAARLYKLDGSLGADQMPMLLLELRSNQGQAIWVKRSDFDQLQGELTQLQKEFAIAQEKMNAQDKYVDYQISSTASKWALGLLAFLLGGGIASFVGINKKIKNTAALEQDRILAELDNKRVSILEETEQESTSLVAGVAGRISYLMFRLLDEGLLDHNKALEKLVKDVILDLSKNYVAEFLLLSPEKHLKQKTQQVSNIIYYMAKFFDEDQLKINKERLEGYIEAIEPDLDTEKQQTRPEKLGIWAEKKLCLLFADYKIHPKRQKKIKARVLELVEHLSEESFAITKKDFEGIDFAASDTQLKKPKTKTEGEPA